MRVIAIAAVARNGVIGSDGSIPWHLPADFAHFKTTTLGHTLLMGRATYDSIGRPLPGRSTIVLSRDAAFSVSHESVTVARSVGEALALAAELPGDLYVAGGAAVYEALLPHLDEQLISEVHLEPAGDTHYPAIDRATWHEVERRRHEEFDVVRWRRVAQSS
ncbi:MAG: dihydrofolate reductase [Nocardioides sp.]